MNNLRGRLSALERGRADGRCPECGFTPDDIKTIYVGADPDAPLPDRERCPVCGDFARLEFIEAPDTPDDATDDTPPDDGRDEAPTVARSR